MHTHIEWDDPGVHGVEAHYAKDPNNSSEPHPGTIVSGRYQGMNVRVKVEAYKDKVSIGEVAALIDAKGERVKQHGKLSLGDIVRLPDDKRAFESAPAPEKEDDD
nr:hypothetical protein [uncultured Halomonas sp.]